jgi:hypothetical protein
MDCERQDLLYAKLNIGKVGSNKGGYLLSYYPNQGHSGNINRDNRSVDLLHPD